MSDVPTPPPGSASIPPPPPPQLMAPPGYVGYAPGPMRSVTLRRINGVGRAAIVLVALAGLTPFLSYLAGLAVRGTAEDFLADRIDRDEFLRSVAPFALVSVVQLVVTVAAAVLVIIWMYRIAANHRTLHRGGTWGPGWAIGGWFVPPLLNVIPFLMFRELWKASDPAVPVGGDWRRGSASPLITAWFAVYGLAQAVVFALSIGDTLGSLGSSERQLAEQLTGDQTVVLVDSVVSILGAALFVAFAVPLSRRHRQLTGESGRR